jgi:hypothetical protein
MRGDGDDRKPIDSKFRDSDLSAAGLKMMIRPRLLLKDGRTLVFEDGPSQRDLAGLRETDVVAAGDERPLEARGQADESISALDFDLAYVDRNNQRVAVEFRIIQSYPTASVLQRRLDDILHGIETHGGRFDRVELWRLDKSSSQLLIWSYQRETQTASYGLTEIASTE